MTHFWGLGKTMHFDLVVFKDNLFSLRQSLILFNYELILSLLSLLSLYRLNACKILVSVESSA